MSTEVFDVEAIACWADYFAARGFRPTDLPDATTYLTMPLTILFGVKTFRELGVLVMSRRDEDSGRETLRVDVVGAQVAEQATLSAGGFAEVARAFPACDVYLRLIGPEVDTDAAREAIAACKNNPVTLRISSHRMLYQDFCAQQTDGEPEPDIVFAPNAGVRESWYPAIQKVCELNIPLMITGYDLHDAVASLRPLYQNLPKRPRVVRDGCNPFAGWPFCRDAAESHQWAKAEAKETSVGEVLSSVQDPQKALLTAQSLLVGDVRPDRGSSIMLNSHYFLIHGYE